MRLPWRKSGITETLEVRPNYEAMRRYLAQGDEINHALDRRLRRAGGGSGGPGRGVFPAGRAFVRRRPRQPGAAGTQLPLRSAEGTLMLTLKQVASVVSVPRLNRLTHENGQRRRAVMVNVHGQDVAGFVRAARRAVADAVPLEAGYRVEFGGTFEQLDSARARLLTLAAVGGGGRRAGLVFLAMGSWRQTLVVCVAVPLALVGGVLALALRGMPFTIPAAVGFIALGGVAMLNSLVLASRYGQLARGGVPRARRPPSRVPAAGCVPCS